MLASKIGLLGGSRTLVISSNQTNFNLHTALGSPSTPVRATVVINSGVVISSNNASTPAFDEGALPAGSSVTLINNGSIRAFGGAGGAGGTAFYDSPFTPDLRGSAVGSNGQSGGNALRLTAPTVVVNGAGEIFGGGGGGGGGGGVAWFTGGEESYFQANGGGGGGGGRSVSTSSAGAAGVASSNYFIPGVVPHSGVIGSTGGPSGAGSGGTGGDSNPAGISYVGASGGAGGDWGAAGSAGQTPSTPPYEPGIPEGSAVISAGGSGGAAGKAVDLNGQSITWVSGNTVDRVKGAVS